MKIQKIIGLLLVLFVAIPFALAHESHDPHDLKEQAEAIMNAEIPCDLLTDEQFESLGEYAMELMHPGELHEAMDEAMGGEGSESLLQAHINMGRAFYCGEMPGGVMMNSMMGTSSQENYNNRFMGMMFDSNGEASQTLFWITLMPIFFVLSIIAIVVLLYLLLRR